MLVKKGGGFKGSEITPYDMYLNRRAFIFGAAAALALGPGGVNAAQPAGPAAQGHPQPRLQGRGSDDPGEGRHDLQQLL